MTASWQRCTPELRGAPGAMTRGKVRYRGLVEPPRYDTIGTGYARTRRADPRLRARIHAALGDAKTVVNVGAGAGSYEPIDRHVIAIEPSDVLVAQRPRALAPALRGTADDLPLRDGAVDAAMAILTIHHWDDPPLGRTLPARRARTAPRRARPGRHPDVRRRGRGRDVAGQGLLPRARGARPGHRQTIAMDGQAELCMVWPPLAAVSSLRSRRTRRPPGGSPRPGCAS